jgi:hypothetical protein
MSALAPTQITFLLNPKNGPLGPQKKFTTGSDSHSLSVSVSAAFAAEMTSVLPITC